MKKRTQYILIIGVALLLLLNLPYVISAIEPLSAIGFLILTVYIGLLSIADYKNIRQLKDIFPGVSSGDTGVLNYVKVLKRRLILQSILSVLLAFDGLWQLINVGLQMMEFIFSDYYYTGITWIPQFVIIGFLLVIPIVAIILKRQPPQPPNVDDPDPRYAELFDKLKENSILLQKYLSILIGVSVFFIIGCVYLILALSSLS